MSYDGIRLYEAGLTKEEQEELGESLAQGGISRSCSRICVDWFNKDLSTGKRVVGSYRWGSEDWRTLRVYKGKRRLF